MRRRMVRATSVLGGLTLAALSSYAAGSKTAPPVHAPGPAAPGSASAKAEEPKTPTPKITGVSPSVILLDGSAVAVTIDLSGSDFPERDVDLQVSFDSDPAEHLQIVPSSAVVRVSSSLMRVTITAPAGKTLEDVLSADVAQKFRVVGNVVVGKQKKFVGSEPSSASLTARSPLFARRIWVIDPPLQGDRQVRLQVPSMNEEVRVNLVDTSGDKVACTTPKVFGGDQVVCYLPRSVQLVAGAHIQVLRPNEHEAPAIWNESKLATGMDDPPATPELCAPPPAAPKSCPHAQTRSLDPRS